MTRKKRGHQCQKLKHACFKSLLKSALEISEDPPTTLPLTYTGNPDKDSNKKNGENHSSQYKGMK